jgi:UDP-N-acetylmuramoyl-tripeptide--D-alanyl-D-alanine ligase
MAERLTLADILTVLARFSADPTRDWLGAGYIGGCVIRFDRWATQVSRVVIDSRRCIRGSAFVALRGEQGDGHQYVGDAFARGAVCAIVERVPPLVSTGQGMDAGCVVVDLAGGQVYRTKDDVSCDGPICLVVEDALDALQRLAAWWRARFPVRVIGITGSVGKTTTKEFVASVLSQRYHVLKSQGNYNNEIGLPLTLLDLDESHERVILEMGTYGPGEITLLSQIAHPRVGIVTNVGPVHLERMGSIERIAQAKSELPRSLPSDGVAILNADDERVRSMAEETPAQVFLYGLTPASSEAPDGGCDLWADQIESRGLDGIRFCFHYAPKANEASVTVHAEIPMLGRHSVYTALRAAAAGLVEGLSWDEILRGLRAGEQLRLLAIPGINGSTLLDDTYNSSPDSAIAALNLLDELDVRGRKVAVLGDMLELGAYEMEGHRRVARRAVEVVSVLITVGELGRLIGREAVAFGMPAGCTIHVEDNEAAIALLQGMVQENDSVLVKG